MIKNSTLAQDICLKKNAVVVLPTYNERENIEKILLDLLKESAALSNYRMSILVVDDTSPDGTGDVVKAMKEVYGHIHLLTGPKRGLGDAYLRGFAYATKTLKANVVFEMDADLSHDPHDIPRLLQAIDDGADFVIGSRYIPGGSVPKEWSLLRKINSKFGNIFARHIAGLSSINDCTSGYRAISTSLLRRVNLSELDVSGYAFQMNLLFASVRKGAVVREVPIQFRDRVHGESKIRLSDITEFIRQAFFLRFPFLKLLYSVRFLMSLSVALMIISIIYFTGAVSAHDLFLAGFFLFSFLMAMQGILNIYFMLYAWEDGESTVHDGAPRNYFPAHLSFTALLPARNEENVIEDTIRAIHAIEYPVGLKELIVICKSDDFGTIKKIRETIISLRTKNIRLVTFDTLPINKPHALNAGLREATKDTVVVFDAEDQPHKDIYKIINTVMLRDNADVVQAGVQLMNYRSRWFSTLNVLEYFFWFKSSLHYFAKMGVVPLGGNTVFLRRKLLIRHGGWDEQCLTEDADIGIRMSVEGARISVMYDERFVTKEETPTDVSSFIKQRSRWNLGFMQIIKKGDWLKLPTISQRLLILYVLLMPELQALSFVLIPFTIFMIFAFKLPVIFALFSIIPSLILILQLVIYMIGIYEFTSVYLLRFTIFTPLKVLITFYPFQLLLGFASVRAISRLISKNDTWEKTLHINAHREIAPALRAI